MHAHVVCRVGRVEWVCWGPKLQCHVHTEQLTKGLLVLLRWLFSEPPFEVACYLSAFGLGGGGVGAHLSSSH